MNNENLMGVQFAPVPELDVFESKKMQVSLVDYVEFNQSPSLPFTNTSPIVFELPASTELWTSPNIYIDFMLKVTKKAKSASEIASAPSGYLDVNKSTDKVTLSMLPFHSLISDYQVALNDLVINGKYGHYPYVAFVQRVHLTDEDDRKIHEALELGKLDSSTDLTETTGKSQQTRLTLMAGGRLVPLRGKLCGSIFDQKKFILPGVSISITLFQTDSSFRIMSDTDDEYKVEIVKANIVGRRYVCNSRLFMMTMEQLKKQPAIYNFTRMVPSIFQLPTGQQTGEKLLSLTNGLMPRALAIMLVDSKGAFGNFQISPYKSYIDPVESCYVQVDDKMFPPL